MTEGTPSTQRPLLATITVLLALVGVAPTASAECGDLDDRCTYPAPTEGALGMVDCTDLDPGDPGPGALGAATWFAAAATYVGCSVADESEDAALGEGGDAAWQAGTLVAGLGVIELVRSQLPECFNGVDDDGDGFTDYRPLILGGGDPECTNAFDDEVA